MSLDQNQECEQVEAPSWGAKEKQYPFVLEDSGHFGTEHTCPSHNKASGKSFLRAALHVESRFIVNKDAKAQILVQHIPEVD